MSIFRFCCIGSSGMETFLPQLRGDEQDDQLQVGQVRSDAGRRNCRNQSHSKRKNSLESSNAQTFGGGEEICH